MRVTNSDVIKNREKELLEMISGDLDRDVMRKMLSAKYQMELDGDRLTCRGGELVVHDNQVAYQIEYEAVVTLSLMFNRQGLCLEIVPSAAGEGAGKTDAETPESGYYAYAPEGKAADEVIPDDGHYAYTCREKTSYAAAYEAGEYADAATGQESGKGIPETGHYAYAASGSAVDDAAQQEGAYAAADIEKAAGSSEENVAPGAADGGDPPSARMASTIAEMIAEINKV
ncbi:MAG: hypothetical protein AB1724_05525 [Thermodesulfobacteriota bacterium]